MKMLQVRLSYNVFNGNVRKMSKLIETLNTKLNSPNFHPPSGSQSQKQISQSFPIMIESLK